MVGDIMSLEKAIKAVKPVNKEAIEASKKHWLNVAKPLFSLGKLESLVTQIAGIKANPYFNIDKKALIIMCADNGVVEEGVTQTTQDITAMVTENFIKGKTSVCIMSEIAGVDIFPIDIGVAVDVEGVTDKAVKLMYGTDNMTKGPAMTRETALSAIDLGINKVGELKNKGYDIIATGEMGIGNTTTSSAVASVLLDIPPESITGRGAGLSSEGLVRKINAIKKAIAVNKPDKNDVTDVISKVGGLDIAGLVGVFIGGGVYNIPVVIDGFISAVAALAAVRLCPKLKDYIIASHISKEPGGHIVINELNLDPVINANMCLGEGTGAVALFPMLDMAYGVYRKMTTFDSWENNEPYYILK